MKKANDAGATPATPFRILLATDDSEPARLAEEWIARLSTTRPPLVEVVSVALPGLSRFGWALQAHRSQVRQALEDVRQRAFQEAERLANSAGDRLQARGLRVHAWARQGDPVEELLSMIEEEEPDLVAVGPRGQSAISELFLGSVSHQLVLYSTRPVLVARAADVATDQGAEAAPGQGADEAADRAADRLPQSVLFVLSGSRSDERAARWLAEEGLLQASRVVAITVGEEMSPEAPDLIVDLDEQIRREHTERVMAALEPLRERGIAVDHVFSHGHPVREAFAAADRHACDLIVVPRPAPRRARRPLAEDLAHQARCSVLVIPTS